MFKHLPGESAVVRKGGIFRTCDLYEYRGALFVKYGSGFVRLNADGGARLDGLSIDMLAYDKPLFKDRFGRLCVNDEGGYTAVQANPDGTIVPLKLEGPK